MAAGSQKVAGERRYGERLLPERDEASVAGSGMVCRGWCPILVRQIVSCLLMDSVAYPEHKTSAA
jgi:hypothetical protein